MTTAPAISVCIANYNGKDVIEDCIDSVLRQVGNLPLEIIVHDDCSTDGSAELIESRYPQVKLIPSTGNVGFCISNNRMAAVAVGEFLLLLNNDAVLFPDAIDTLHKAAKEIACPAILGLPQYDAASGDLLDVGSLFDPFLNPVPNKDPNRGDVGMVMGACLWIPKLLWVELGGFPEWFGSIGEDLYLCCRARLAGYPVRALGNSGYRHWVGTSFGGGKILVGRRLSTTVARRALSERNKTFALVACHPAPLLMVLLPLHVILIHLEGMLLTLCKWDHGIWRGIYAPLIPALWRRQQVLRSLRQRTQMQRKATLRVWLAAFHWIPRKVEMLIRHGVPDIEPPNDH